MNPDSMQLTTLGADTAGPPMCAGCQEMILDEYILQVQGRNWHTQCLRCVICRNVLNGCCYAKDDHVYCRDDFTRIFGAKCSGCNGVIPPAEGVRSTGVGVYHLPCFSCVLCGCGIETGDTYFIREDKKLLCQTDYDDLTMREHESDCSDTDSAESAGSGKRHRTCITGPQLIRLQRAYLEDPKPQRHIRRKLSRETGLSMRVIQVWFQNRRAKGKMEDAKMSVYDPESIDCFTSEKISDNVFDIRQHMCLEKDGRTSTPVNESFSQTLCAVRPHSFEQSPPLNRNWDCLSDECMPPNVNLTASDLKDGEVIFGKHIMTIGRYSCQNGAISGSGYPIQERQQPWVTV